jgi:hypothetical protein
MAKDLKRRQLRFEHLDQAVNDARMLQATGYDRAGTWDLSQVCGHLATGMEFAIDGFPPNPPHLRFVFWIMRSTLGPIVVRRIVRTGAMASRAPAIKQSILGAGGDETQAVERLQRAVTRFQNHTGPLYPSPIFGSLDREQLHRLQLIHCEHHLGFLLPKSHDPTAAILAK